MTYTQVKECIRELGRKELEDLLDQRGEEVIEDALVCNVSPSQIDEAYQGHFNSDGDFAMNFYDGVYGLSKLEREFPGLQVDWEDTARDLMIDYSEENGNYFRVL